MVFLCKKTDALENEFLCKARSTLRGDLQNEKARFDFDMIYAPVATHKSIRALFALYESIYFISKACNISNIYLYEKSIFLF